MLCIQDEIRSFLLMARYLLCRSEPAALNRYRVWYLHEILKALYEVCVVDRLMHEKCGYEYVFHIYSCNTYRDGFGTAIESSSRHILLADVPRDYGGGNAGPKPYRIATASLVSCFAISLRIYLQKYGVRIDRVEVLLKDLSIYRCF
ncbi:MAG: hypothetical protein QW836_09315 [Ignisphaera sp.]